MDEPLASVRFEQTIEDVVALHVRIASRPAMVEMVRGRNLRNFAAAAVIVVPGLAWGTYAMASDPKRGLVALAVFGVLMSIVLVHYGIKVGGRAGVRAMIERSTGEMIRSGRIPLTLGPNEIALHRGWCEATDRTTRIEKMWEAGATVHDEPEGVFIEFADSTVMMVPRRAFASDAERERFVGVSRGLAGK